jgi:DNA (cytosine-5)-methyltransferase 1
MNYVTTLAEADYHERLTDSRQKRAPAASKTTNKYSVVSMFSGCGGMDLGFLGGFDIFGKSYARNPFEVVWANELNPFACATYSKNLGHPISQGDVWELLNTLPKNADVVVGGFPCQDISINGKLRGVNGARSGLYRAMVEAVRRVKPKVFVAENVKGLLMTPNKSSLSKVINDFEGLGYEVSYQVYKAVEFGVPQNRERVFIVGRKKGIAAFVPPIGHLRNGKYMSAQEAIDDLRLLPEDQSINHIWSKAEKSSDQGGRKLAAHKPSATIRAECHGNNQFHYALGRRISMREAARFQTFPDTFIFQSKLRETERQIGNAVPPVLAWHIARAVLDVLKPR